MIIRELKNYGSPLNPESLIPSLDSDLSTITLVPRIPSSVIFKMSKSLPRGMQSYSTWGTDPID